VGGVPAKIIGQTADLANRLQTQTEQLPWASIIKNRAGAFDPAVEAELINSRVKYFYPS